MKRKYIIPIAVVFLLLVVTYLVPTFYFRDHFFTCTYINGNDFSYFDINKCKDEIQKDVKGYALRLVGRYDTEEIIDASEIELKYEENDYLENLLKSQNEFLWFIEVFKTHEYISDNTIVYNKDLLSNRISNLNFYKESLIIDYQNAYLSEYDEEMGRYFVINEVLGNRLIADTLDGYIIEAIEKLQKTLILDEIGCYIEPEITTKTPEIIEAISMLNQLVSTEITYDFGDYKEVLNGNTIHKWIQIDGFTVTLNYDEVYNYVKSLSSKYNTFGKKRTFITTEGVTRILPSGGFGWRINRTNESQELYELICKGIVTIREPVYTYRGAVHGELNDIGNTYIEINLTDQHMYVYQDGYIVLESDFVSGDIKSGCMTPEGVFDIRNKKTETVLRGSMDNGSSWETPVHYWMPFNGGIGLHDATWRKRFGGNIYLTNGSHGCINLPYQNAETLFEMVYVGMPVICYYELEEENNLDDQQTDVNGNPANPLEDEPNFIEEGERL